MRERNRHPEWMERLVFNDHVEPHSYAAIISSNQAVIAVEFSRIVEFVSRDRIKQLPFLSDAFCGVVVDRSIIYPVIAFDDTPQAVGHVMLVSDGQCSFGIRFAGTPRVANLDHLLVRTTATATLPQKEAANLPAPLVAEGLLDSPEGRAILLDVSATASALSNPA